MSRPVERAGVAGKPRIMLVDDDPELGAHIAGLLSPQYSILTATDWGNGLYRALETLPDLLIAKMSVPGDNGLEVIRELRRDTRSREMPIMVYSAPGGEELRIRAIEAGVNDYLTKPFTDRELLARIRVQLDRADLRLRTLRTLRVSEERYRTLATATTAAVWQATPNGSIFGEVVGWESMTGQTREQYSGWAGSMWYIPTTDSG